MRISTNSISDNLITQFQRLTANQNRLQNQVATGQRITNPSDDPAAMGRVLNIENEKRQLEQFAKNNDHATAISKTTYTAVEQLKKTSDRARELSVLGHGIVSPEAYKAYAAEVNQLLEQGVQVANTKLSGDFILGGTKTATAPFAPTRDPSGKITSVAYTGAASGASFRIAEAAQISPYTDGATNLKLRDSLNELVALRDALDAGNIPAIKTSQQNLGTIEDNFLITLSDLGSTQTRLEVNDAQNQSRFYQLETLKDNDTGVNLPEVLVRLNQSETAYQAALQSGAKLLTRSLMDYLS